MKIYISHPSSYDYEQKLYRPIKEAAFYRQHEFFLPHEPQNINVTTKDIIAAFNILIAEVSAPSTGQGIELGLATAANVPIYCFYKQGAQPSSSLKLYCQNIETYADTTDLIQKIARIVDGKVQVTNEAYSERGI